MTSYNRAPMRATDIPTNKTASPHAARVIRVLIADDERDIVLTLSALLRDEGYDVKGVHSAHDAIVAVADFDPHVVIADIAMPERSGWDIAREIRATRGRGRPDRPLLIAMSGIYNKGSDRILAEMTGFNYFLAKPFEPNVLLRLLPPVTPPPANSTQ
jgi:two-component system, OmpR family, response regulator